MPEGQNRTQGDGSCWAPTAGSACAGWGEVQREAAAVSQTPSGADHSPCQSPQGL